MNQNLILVGLGAAILIAAGILFFKDDPQDVAQKNTSQEQSPAVETATTTPAEPDGGLGDEPYHALVSFTDEGYSPATATIKKGQTVRFVNNATMGTWPASAAHPTHGVYPQKSDSDCLGSSFDACRNLAPGEFWEFTFNEVGSWGFHDHSHAKFRGTVVVTE